MEDTRLNAKESELLKLKQIYNDLKREFEELSLKKNRYARY